MHKLSVIMIAKNEERDIGQALESVKWADQIIVIVDDQSQDRTEEIARKYTPEVAIEPFKGYVELKMEAVKKARNDWILWLDADEALSKGLIKEIQTLPRAGKYVAYRIPRRSQFMGEWMKHAWSPKRDRPIRLFSKKSCNFITGQKVHESLRVQGKVGGLENLIDHYTFKDMRAHLARINRYSSLAAEQMHQQGVKFSAGRLLWKPIYAFLLSYFKRQGFRDGLRGFVLCVFYAYNTFCDWAKLWEIEENKHGDTLS